MPNYSNYSNYSNSSLPPLRITTRGYVVLAIVTGLYLIACLIIGQRSIPDDPQPLDLCNPANSNAVLTLTERAACANSDYPEPL